MPGRGVCFLCAVWVTADAVASVNLLAAHTVLSRE